MARSAGINFPKIGFSGTFSERFFGFASDPVIDFHLRALKLGEYTSDSPGQLINKQNAVENQFYV